MKTVFNLTPAEEERALELHRGAVVVEAHADYSLEVARRRLRDREKRVLEKRILPMLVEGNVRVVMITFGGDKKTGEVWGPTRDDSFLMLDLLESEFEESPERIGKVLHAADIDTGLKEGKTLFILGLEGCMAMGGDLLNLRLIHRLGARSLQLTWNAGNLVADGCGEKRPRGLTNYGFRVIDEANRLGMILDISHLAETGVKDVVDASKRPIVASHSNAKALCEHPRNLSDESIRAIAERGGVIGMNFFPGFIDRKSPSMGRLLDHIDYMVKLVGVKHVGLGPDFTYFAKEIFVEALPEMGKQGISFTPEEFDVPPDLRDSSVLPNVTRGLVSRGYSDEEILAVLGGNFLRIYRTCLP